MKFFACLFLILFFFNFNVAKSQEKIAFINMEKIMTKSIAGTKATEVLEKKHKSNIAKFKKLEESLKKEEIDILAKKNILKKEEVEKKILDLREKTKKYSIERRKEINKLTKDRIDISNKFLQLINPIIAEYISKNSIAIVIRKKDVVIGKSELDITDPIIAIVDKKIQDITIN